MSSLKKVKRGERLFSTPLVDLTGYLEGVFELLLQATIALIGRLPIARSETERLAQRNIEMNAQLAAQAQAHEDEARELRELRVQLETLRGEHARLQRSYALVRGDYDQALDQMQLMGLWKPGRETRIQSMATAHISRVEFVRPKERGRSRSGSASGSRSASRSVSPASAAGVGADSRTRQLAHSGSLSTMRRAQSAKMARRTPVPEEDAMPRRRLSLTVTSTPASPAALPAAVTVAAVSASGSPRGASAESSLASSSGTPAPPSEPLDAATLALLAEDNSETDFLFQRPAAAAVVHSQAQPQPQPRSAQSTQRHRLDGPAGHLAALASSASLDEFAEPAFGEEEKELYGGVVALKSAQERERARHAQREARERERERERVWEQEQHVSDGRQAQRGWVVAEAGSTRRPLSPSPSPSRSRSDGRRPGSSSAGRTRATAMSPQRGHALSRSSAAAAGQRARDLSPARPTASFTSNKKFDLRDIGGTNMHLGCSSTSFDYHTFSVSDAAATAAAAAGHGGNTPAINKGYETYQGRERPAHAHAGRRPSSSPSRQPANNHNSPSRSRPSSQSRRLGPNSHTNSYSQSQSGGGRRALSAVNRGGGITDGGPRRALQFPQQQQESAEQAEQRAWELQRQLGKPRRTALETRGLHEAEIDPHFAAAAAGGGGIVIRDEDDGDSDAEEAAQAEPRRHHDHHHHAHSAHSHARSASSKRQGPSAAALAQRGPSRSPGRSEAQPSSHGHGHGHADQSPAYKRSMSNSHFRSPAQAASLSSPHAAAAAAHDPVAAYYGSLSVDSDALIVSQVDGGGAFMPALSSSVIRHIATKQSLFLPQDTRPAQGHNARPAATGAVGRPSSPAALLARAHEVHSLAASAAASAPRPISARAPVTSKRSELDARDTASILSGAARYEKFVREIDDGHGGQHAHSAPHEQSSRSSTHRSSAAATASPSPSPDISALVIERFMATGDGSSSDATRAAEQQKRARAAELAAKAEAARADLRREHDAKSALELAQARLQQQEKLSQLLVAEDHATASVFATSAQANAAAAELLRKKATQAAAALSSPPPPAKQEQPPAPSAHTEPSVAAISAPAATISAPVTAASASGPASTPPPTSVQAPAPLLAPAPAPVTVVSAQPSETVDPTPAAAHPDTSVDTGAGAQPADSSSSAAAPVSPSTPAPTPVTDSAAVVIPALAPAEALAVDSSPPATPAVMDATATSASATSEPVVSNGDVGLSADSSVSAFISASAADPSTDDAAAIAAFRFTVPASAPVMAAASAYDEDFVSVEAAQAAAAAAWGDDGDGGADGDGHGDGDGASHVDFVSDGGGGRALVAVKEEDEDADSQAHTRTHSRSHSTSVNAAREDSRRNSSAQRLARFKANVKSAQAEA